MADINSTDISNNAKDPKRATVDGNTVEQHSIQDQIAAAEFAAANAANGSAKRGFVLQKLKAPGAQ